MHVGLATRCSVHSAGTDPLPKVVDLLPAAEEGWLVRGWFLTPSVHRCATDTGSRHPGAQVSKCPAFPHLLRKLESYLQKEVAQDFG